MFFPQVSSMFFDFLQPHKSMPRGETAMTKLALGVNVCALVLYECILASRIVFGFIKSLNGLVKIKYSIKLDKLIRLINSKYFRLITFFLTFVYIWGKRAHLVYNSMKSKRSSHKVRMCLFYIRY